jgi:hypothetical protein
MKALPPPRRAASALAAAAALTILSLSPAQAQVRKCQVDGRVVFQSAPCPPEPRVASAAPIAQPTAPGTSGVPKKKTLADLLRERDGIDRGRAQPIEHQGDGANVLRSRMGAV